MGFDAGAVECTGDVTGSSLNASQAGFLKYGCGWVN
jgi:hypothetical protein